MKAVEEMENTPLGIPKTIQYIIDLFNNNIVKLNSLKFGPYGRSMHTTLTSEWNKVTLNMLHTKMKKMVSGMLRSTVNMKRFTR